MEETLVKCYEAIAEADKTLKEVTELKLQVKDDEIAELKAENKNLKAENERLKRTVNSLRDSIDELKAALRGSKELQELSNNGAPAVTQGPNSCIVIDPGGNEMYF